MSWLVLMRVSWATTNSRCTIRGELSDPASLVTKGGNRAGTMGPTCGAHIQDWPSTAEIAGLGFRLTRSLDND